MDIPETRYVKTPDGTYIAFQVVGEGPTDLVYVLGSASRLDTAWEQPLGARFLRSLASFPRLVVVDRRGSGLSDPVVDAALPLEAQMDDVRSVLDAIGAERAAVFGTFEGGVLCALFAATHPERTKALVLYGTYARGAWAPDYPWAWTDEEFEADIARMGQALEGGWIDSYLNQWMEEFVPSLANQPTYRPWLRKVFRASNRSFARMRMEREVDIRAVLPAIRVPTLVLNREGDRIADFDEGRWLAHQIKGAKFVRLAGDDHPPWAGDQLPVLDAISRFLGLTHRPLENDRVLATVLFTDIVGSTSRLAELGDARWKELVADHNERAKTEIERAGGRFVDSSGDGLFATFDGPARAVRCARAFADAVRALGIEIRAGCHTGEIEVDGEHVRGISVHIGARVAALAAPSEILVSQTVKDLVAGSGLAFEDAGEHELKGVPDRWRLYRVLG